MIPALEEVAITAHRLRRKAKRSHALEPNTKFRLLAQS
jgi:hypothetical protein